MRCLSVFIPVFLTMASIVFLSSGTYMLYIYQNENGEYCHVNHCWNDSYGQIEINHAIQSYFINNCTLYLDITTMCISNGTHIIASLTSNDYLYLGSLLVVIGAIILAIIPISLISSFHLYHNNGNLNEYIENAEEIEMTTYRKDDIYTYDGEIAFRDDLDSPYETYI